jgi:hypothetical protein
LASKNEYLKREDPTQIVQSTEMETQHKEETCLMLNYVSNVISDLLITIQTFFKDCKIFFSEMHISRFARYDICYGLTLISNIKVL